MRQPNNMKFGRLTLKFLDDPYTPVIVAIGKETGTYYAVMECGATTGSDEIVLEEKEMNFLTQNEPLAEAWHNFRWNDGQPA